MIYTGAGGRPAQRPASTTDARHRLEEKVAAAKAQAAAALVDQTILASDPKRLGNCVSACVASLLNIPLGAVPHFVELGSDLAGDDTDQHAWWWTLVGFMAGHGLWPVELERLEDAERGEVVFVAGPSPRGVDHQVLYRDGVLWHDPHPSRDGVLKVTEVLAWRPGQHDHKPTEVPS